jgi:hypothetical protein
MSGQETKRVELIERVTSIISGHNMDQFGELRCRACGDRPAKAGEGHSLSWHRAEKIVDDPEVLGMFAEYVAMKGFSDGREQEQRAQTSACQFEVVERSR